MMSVDIDRQRNQTIEKIIARQDGEFRWSFDEGLTRKRPELRNYLPKYASTLWTMLYLAELKIPPGDGWWNLERPAPGLITSSGAKNRPNAFVTERAREVLAFYG